MENHRKIGILKYIITNVGVFFFGVFIIDIILGDYFRFKNPVKQIPWALRDVSFKYDISKNYDSLKNNLIFYTRDNDGYRSITKDKNKIILTIGGSTTDQRLVDDNSTWQALMNKNKTFSSFNIINAGVDGQSSYGHLFSLQKWHSITLPKEKVKLVIYYLGVNDRLILNEGKKYTLSKTQNYLDKIKFFISNNSFFYKKIKIIKNKYIKKKNDTEVMWIHQKRDYPFLSQGKKKVLKKKEYLGEKVYSEIIRDLLIKSKLKFPNAKVIFVQQQAPGCEYLNKNTFLDRLPKEIRLEKFCEDVFNIYKIQNTVINNLPKEYKPKILEMYKEKIISDDGVYDYIHNNEKGALEISQYLINKIKPLLK